ncbi:MAG: type II secretion system protein [Vulcanimicrobiota bacterium]
MKRAFTLLEALVTLGLVAVVFGALMIMLLQAFRIARKSSDKTVTAEAAELGLERMSSEAREALLILNPVVGATDTQLVFKKVNPDNSVTNRLPNTPPAPDTTAIWDPFTPTYLLKVRYSLSGEQLMREVGPAVGPSTATMRLCERTRYLKVIRPESNHLTLELSVQDGQLVTAYTTEVICHAVP